MPPELDGFPLKWDLPYNILPLESMSHSSFLLFAGRSISCMFTVWVTVLLSFICFVLLEWSYSSYSMMCTPLVQLHSSLMLALRQMPFSCTPLRYSSWLVCASLVPFADMLFYTASYGILPICYIYVMFHLPTLSAPCFIATGLPLSFIHRNFSIRDTNNMTIAFPSGLPTNHHIFG